jgi:Glu-tRNA(Gln) amidotransferase subunit E-like FAD-binding protein
MYPDTDSPPTRVTRERVALLKSSLSERPWDRERRYAAVGVPVSTAHYLIRRGGAVLVDRLAKETGAAVRDVAFLFGERLKGLRRASVPVDAIPEERWAELLRAFVATPVLKQAWEQIVLAIAATPARAVGDLLAERALGVEPPAWRAGIPAAFAAATEKAYRKEDARLVRRLAFASLMPGLLGRVPASEVEAAVTRAANGVAEVRA